MSDTPWHLVVPAPILHIPHGRRKPTYDTVSVRTAFVPRHATDAEMPEIRLGGFQAGSVPRFRTGDGSLWVLAEMRFPGTADVVPMGVDALRRFLAAGDRTDGFTPRASVFSGGPLVPRADPGGATLMARPDLSGIRTRGMVWEGTERAHQAALDHLSRDFVICEGAGYVRSPGPLLAPAPHRRGFVATLHPAACDPVFLLMPAFVAVADRDVVRAGLMAGGSMLPPFLPDLGKSYERDGTWSGETPFRVHDVPKRLLRVGADVRATAMAAPAYVIAQASRHLRGDGEAAAALGRALRPLALLDLTMRHGIATDDEVESALRLSLDAVEAARIATEGRHNKDLANFAHEIRVRVLPKLARMAKPLPKADEAFLLGLSIRP